MKNLKRLFLNLPLLLFSVAFTILAAEAALRAFSCDRHSYPRHYYMADEAAGYDISPNFPARQHHFVDSKHLIWSNELGIFDRPYRGEKDYILLIGDSFTWGFTPFEDKYGTVLERCLGYRVLKCGVPGYGIRQEAIKAEKILSRVKERPRLVIVGYYAGSDFPDDWCFPQYAVIDGDLVTETVIRDFTTGERTAYSPAELAGQVRNFRTFGTVEAHPGLKAGIKFWLTAHSRLYFRLSRSPLLRRAVKGFWAASENPERVLSVSCPVAYIPVERYPWLETAWENHLSNFIRIKTLCDRSGAELLVVIIPPKEEVYRSLRHQPAAVQYDWDQPDRLARSYFERKGIPYFDLTPHFRRYADQTPRNRLDSVKDLYWRTDGHWNVRGNRLAGLLLAEYILTNSMINIDNPQEKKRATEDELKTLNPNYFS